MPSSLPPQINVLVSGTAGNVTAVVTARSPEVIVVNTNLPIRDAVSASYARYADIVLGGIANAISSSYAVLATSASAATSITFVPISASYSLSSSYSQQSLSSSFAVSASYVRLAQSASALTFTPPTASYAISSSLSQASISSSFAAVALTAVSSSAATSITFIPPTASFASVAISASYAANVSAADWNTLLNRPSGIVSSSSQVNTGSFSGSFIGSASYATIAISASYAANSAGAADWNTLLNRPVGIVSSSSQINTGSFTGSFIGSASYAISASYAANSAGAADWNTLLNRPAGIVSSSVQINSGSFTGSFIGSASYATNALSSSAATSITFIPPTASFALNTPPDSFANITGKPTLVSSSLQINTGSFSGSITSASYSVTASYATIAQNVLGTILSASYALTASYINSGTITNAISSSLATFALTASYALTSSGVIQNAISSSYALSASYSSNVSPSDWNTLLNRPVGIVSSSVQINSGSFTGSFTGNLVGSSSYATSASAATSITFVPASASYAISASYALNGGGSGVSSSYAITASYAAIAQNVLGAIANATSASYALSSSYVDAGTWSGGTGSYLTPTGSTFPMTVTFNNNTYGTTADLLNITASAFEWDTTERVKVELFNYTQVRVGVRVESASAAGTAVGLQYSTDENTWNYLGSSGTTPSASLSTTGSNVSVWSGIAQNARGDVFIRWVTLNGNGSTGTSIGTITMQLK